MAKPRTRRTSTEKTSEAAVDPAVDHVEITSVEEAPAQAELPATDPAQASQFDAADPVVLGAP